MTAVQLNDQTTSFLNEHKLYENDEIQQIQLQHRISLAEAFQLPKGGRILEIGCGQGDTTMAIAHLIGEGGNVVAIDNASRDYGAPFTLGEATNHILQSSIGKRISFHLETDFNDFEVSTPFDVAVFSHSSWYFKNPNELLGFLKRLRLVTKRICFAEWDLHFTEMPQRSHFCAVSILALYSKFVENEGNVQTLFNKTHIQQLLEQAGFHIEKQMTVDATFLPDAKWEIDYANTIQEEFVEAAPHLKPFLFSYYELMNEPQDDVLSLNSFVITAT
ncbi:class I SAM-dependent methyltransferase [Sporosarcina aquimarina]|uniref:Methyltransferase domain-containing protein n=1 Tax=Sporosarcina aquimarina TaxID=114975 RepID=A0ABU4FZK6_9BACL|nr:methyltransferase domain-containing protein [Sporosarcina aquimarina]MDW0109547.1 methyltransferase domain-containing protein [Sporosarcina aquimarina]